MSIATMDMRIASAAATDMRIALDMVMEVVIAAGAVIPFTPMAVGEFATAVVTLGSLGALGVAVAAVAVVARGDAASGPADPITIAQRMSTWRVKTRIDTGGSFLTDVHDDNGDTRRRVYRGAAQS